MDERHQALGDGLAAHLQDAYRIEVTKLEPIDPGFRVDRADGPSWVARVFPSRDVATVEDDADVLRFLEGHGFPAERCAHDQAVTTLGDRTVLVSTWVDGKQHRHGSTCSLDLARSLGELVGRLATLPAEDGAPGRDAGAWHGGGDGLPKVDLDRARAQLDEVEDRVAAHGRAKYDWFRETLAAVDDLGDLPRSFIHPDPALVNVIETEPGFGALVDWTGAGRGPRVASLGNLLMGCGHRGGAEKERVRAVVDGYLTHVRPAPDEIAALPSATRIRMLYFAADLYKMSVMSGYTPTGVEGWWPSLEYSDAVAAAAAEALA